MYTDVTFSMDGRSSAPNRVGSLLVPQAAQYFARWVDRGNRSYVTLMVNTAIVEDMVARCAACTPACDASRARWWCRRRANPKVPPLESRIGVREGMVLG